MCWQNVFLDRTHWGKLQMINSLILLLYWKATIVLRLYMPFLVMGDLVSGLIIFKERYQSITLVRKITCSKNNTIFYFRILAPSIRLIDWVLSCFTIYLWFFRPSRTSSVCVIMCRVEGTDSITLWETTSENSC